MGTSKQSLTAAEQMARQIKRLLNTLEEASHFLYYEESMDFEKFKKASADVHKTLTSYGRGPKP
jgi:hypothetical protein